MNKKKILKYGVIGLVTLVTVANGGLLGYVAKHRTVAATAPTTSKLAAAPVAKVDVTSTKQVQIDPSKQGMDVGTGAYAVQTMQQSRLNDPSTAGKLVLASYQPQGVNFVLAEGSGTNLDSSNVNADWQTTTLSNDTIWAPQSCSSKPTLLLQGRYIFIDDGKTKPTDTNNSYLSYDIQTGAYNYFGGDSFTPTQAKHENVMLATNENDQLVFYIDVSDTKGPLADDPAFKHASGNDAGYIIRRVINPGTMTYTDYHIPYTVPAGQAYFYLATEKGVDQDGPTFDMDSDDGSTAYNGTNADNHIAFTPFVAPTNTNGIPSTPPYDTDLEKQLNDNLTQALPDLASGDHYSGANYTTNFAVTEIGEHASTKFVVATSRNGTQNESPAIIDPDNTVHALINKPILGFGTYVPLGVY